ncbi:MAG TPA: SCO family protein [Aggregatilineales bacterium]|nr:SCO family protein [Aggregatilineales bacterium]
MANSSLDKQMIAFGILLLTGCSPVQRAPTPASTTMVIPDEHYVGEVVQPPILLQDFTMPASTGASMHLSDLNGSWRVMFFGYLHCPDFCPMTLTEYKRVKALLGETGEQVKFLYVSVDGVRDTPEALRRYLANFDPTFIGLSGDDETLAQIQPDYDFYYRRRLPGGSQAVYVIDHSTRSYLIDPQGRLRATFTYDIEPAQIAEAIAWYIEQEPLASQS